MSHLDHVAAGIDAALDPEHGYRTYCDQRSRGLKHDDIAHFYGERADGHRERYLAALNLGARQADEGWHLLEPNDPTHLSPSGIRYRDGQ